MVLVVLVSVVAGLANESFVRIRTYLRLKREATRKGKARAQAQGGGDDKDKDTTEADSLTEPLLGPSKPDVADTTQAAPPRAPAFASRPVRGKGGVEVRRLDLRFEDLVLQVPGAGRVLNGVRGGFRAGRVTALMGPSGCGKTSLVSALSNRLSFGSKLQGRTYVNGVLQPLHDLQELIGFVPQDDVMHADLTVKEELLYSAALRGDAGMTRAEQKDLVESVMESLGLNAQRHTMIGSAESRGISGGQRKRVNVAMVSPFYIGAQSRASSLITV
jgi:ABC-type glutathione transport system ATPase component